MGLDLISYISDQLNVCNVFFYLICKNMSIILSIILIKQFNSYK